MSGEQAVDLHTHSTASDGMLTPTQLIQSAVKVGLSGIGLTDHDTTAGLAEAQDRGIAPRSCCRSRCRVERQLSGARSAYAWLFY